MWPFIPALTVRLLNTWKGCDQVDAKRDAWCIAVCSFTLTDAVFLYILYTFFWLVVHLVFLCPSVVIRDHTERRQLMSRIFLAKDMSRYALDVLGTAMLGQGFGAIDGKFDDTYR